MTDVVVELARLSDPWSVPKLKLPLPDLELTPEEVAVASLIDGQSDLASIMAKSTLAEDATLQVMARLVTLGIVAISPRA
jgi:hypothetical protein